MKHTARVISLLLLVFGLCLVPVSGAAGDPADTGDTSTSDTGSGNGDGTGDTGTGDTGSGDTGSNGSDGGTTQGPPGVSVPRVMVEGFVIEPQTIFAGQEFTVNFSLRNTSKLTQVQNIKVTVSSPDSAFLPQGGSSSLYISRIRAERVSGQTMTFRALPSLEAKPYPLTIAIEYEDTKANAYQSSETLAIEVNQELRADASVPQLTPAALTIGQQGSMTFTIQNQGKAKLFNAKASIAEGQAIAPTEAFVGTIDAGTSGSVDMTVTAVEAASVPVKVTISYEDVTGKSFTLDKEVPVEVAEAAAPVDMGMEDPGMEVEPEPASFPVVPVVIGAVVLIALIALILIVRAAKRRKARREDEASLAAMAGDPLIGDDWQ